MIGTLVVAAARELSMRQFCLLLALAGSAAAQTNSDLLLRHTFDADSCGWTAIGQGGGVRAENGALAFTYELKPKQFALAVLPATPGLAQVQRLRFRVKADHATALALFLSEKKPGGGNYTAWFWAPANTWQQVELTPADFSVSDGPNDPVDANGKLDLDAVEGIGLTDLAQFFLMQADNPDFPVIVDRSTGSHTLLLDDFELLASAGPVRVSGLAIDRFDRGFLEWITMGGMQLKVAPKENPLGMPAMEAAYQQTEGHYGLLLRRIANLDLTKATRLAFDVASEREATLVVSLETRKGQRFNLSIFPPGKREVFHVSLRLADFEGPGRLDPGQLKSIAIADISAAGGGAEQANTIWIGKLEGLVN
jgi:hypothetical protein